MASQPNLGTVYCARCYRILVGTVKHDCGALFCWSCTLQPFTCTACKHRVLKIDRVEELDTMIAESICQYDIPAEDIERYKMMKTIFDLQRLVASLSIDSNRLLKEIIEIERNQRVSSIQPPYQQLNGGFSGGCSRNSIPQLQEEIKRLQELGHQITAVITSRRQRKATLIGPPPPSA